MAALALSWLASGCASSGPPEGPELAASHARSVGAGVAERMAGEPRRTLPPYRLEVGDRLAIEFPYQRELDIEARVRPDGRITVPRAGEVEALGLTPVELEAALVAALAGHLARPEPRVVVREFRPPRVFVGGAVRAPGAFDFHEQLTALRAITAAGGVAPGGALDAVVILREASDGTMRRLRLDLLASLRSGSGLDPVLEPNDLVFVPHQADAGELSDASDSPRHLAQARP